MPFSEVDQLAVNTIRTLAVRLFFQDLERLKN